MPAKVKSITEIKVDRLVNRFAKDHKLSETDPIVKDMRRNMLFSLRMSYGKKAAKDKKRATVPPLFR